MSTLPAEPYARHTIESAPVTGTMTPLRAAAPMVRALILATVVTALIMVGLPAVLAIARAATI